MRTANQERQNRYSKPYYKTPNDEPLAHFIWEESIVCFYSRMQTGKGAPYFCPNIWRHHWFSSTHRDDCSRCSGSPEKGSANEVIFLGLAGGRPRRNGRAFAAAGATRSVWVCRSFDFVRLSCHGKVNDVEPRKDTCENRPKNRTISLPGTHNGDGGTESDARLRDVHCCRAEDLSNNHRLLIS